MNPSTALARVLVDELVRCGVTDAVLAPGSRSAPLAYALHAADAAGRLRLHVRIDERSAGFLALGLAKASGRPVPVVTTSGTAVANLHPAAVEAAQTGVRLLLLTADRPPELRGAGANQTIDQLRLFGTAAHFVEVGVAEERPGQNAYWRSVVARAVGRGGPVHLNLAFRDPLVPEAPEPPGGPAGGAAGGLPELPGGPESPGPAGGAAGGWPESLAGRPGGRPWTELVPAAGPVPPPDDLPARTVVILGDATAQTRRAVALAAARGWPVVAEPSASVDPGPVVLPGGDLVLTAGVLDRLRPDRVLAVGRATLSRAVGRLAASAPLDVVAGADGDWADAGRRADRVLPAVPDPAVPDPGLQPGVLQPGVPDPAVSGPGAPPDPEPGGGPGVGAAGGAADAGPDPVPGGRPGPGGGPGEVDPEWLPAWRAAAEAAYDRARALLDAEPGLPEPAVAAAVLDAVRPGGLLVVGSSKPVRDAFLAGPRAGVRVLANRGAAGIDGTVSTAVGAALGHGGPAYALLGDLTFLHDANGLVIGPGEPRPDLTIVVVNNDGGAIFGTLEQGAPELAGAFERVFGTPHGVDLAALCAATHTPHATVATRAELAAALAEPAGIRVVEVRTDRPHATDLARRLTSS